MAIVKCEECGNSVSTRAATCPHCGAPGPAALEPAAAQKRPESPPAASTPTAPAARPAAKPAAPASPATARPAVRRRPRSWVVNVIIYTLFCVLILLVVALVTRSVVLRVEDGETTRQGYLWWTNSRTDSVGVYSSVHKTVAENLAEAQRWETRGEACVVDAGTRAKVIEGGAKPMFTGVAVQVLSGRCTGFRGWVSVAAWHTEAP